MVRLTLIHGEYHKMSRNKHSGEGESIMKEHALQKLNDTLTIPIYMSLLKSSLNHNSGLNVYSSRAMAALAYAYTTILRNYNEGYKLGKIALALNKSPKLVGDISLGVVNVVFAFKEPIQALLPIILENYKIALKVTQFNSLCLVCS